MTGALLSTNQQRLIAAYLAAESLAPADIAKRWGKGVNRVTDVLRGRHVVAEDLAGHVQMLLDEAVVYAERLAADVRLSRQTP